MCTVTNEIKKLEKAFDKLNAYFYNGELNRPVIQFYADDKQSSYGWITTKEVWNDGSKLHREINICANFADRDVNGIYATLLHEMAHLYNMENGIVDVSNNGFYHNKNFKKTAEAHGLIIEKSPKYGWTITKLNEEGEKVVNILEKLDMNHVRREATTRTRKKQNSYKHVCPKCGAIVRASKKGLHLICADCMELMIEEDKD